MSHAIRKPAFCICENKDADQLRGDLVGNPKTGFLMTLLIYEPSPEKTCIQGC